MHEQNDLSEYAMTTIRCAARKLAMRHGFTSSDRPDIEQELALDLLERRDQYDSSRAGERTFVVQIVKNRCRALARQRALDRANSKPVQLWANASDAEADAPAGNLELIVHQALNDLPQSLSLVAHALMTQSVSDAAAALGMSRSALYRARLRIRKHLAAAGLDGRSPTMPECARYKMKRYSQANKKKIRAVETVTIFD